MKKTTVTERKVKLRGLQRGECPAIHEGIALRRRNKSLTLHVTRGALHLRPDGWLLGWAGELEGIGCLPSGQGLAAARLVAQALPSDKGREYALLHSTTRSTGRSDLLAWARLRVTTPIFREGAPADASVVTDDEGTVEEAPRGLAITLTASDDFLGYEFAWYVLKPRPDGGMWLEFEYSETHIGDEMTRSETTSRQSFDFGPAARYFRVLVLTRISDSDHDTAFLSGSTLSELERRTREVEADPTNCGIQNGCVSVDTRVALLPFVTVRANGGEILAQPGATVGQALREGGETNLEAIAATLNVEKDYAGRLTPVAPESGRRDLLELRLIGGEVLNWQTIPEQDVQ